MSVLAGLGLVYLIIALGILIRFVYGERHELLMYGTCFNGCSILLIVFVAFGWPALAVSYAYHRYKDKGWS